MAKVFIAMPAYGRMNIADTTISLVELAGVLGEHKLFAGFGTVSHPDIAELRNIFLTTFYDRTKASHILFVDSDMSFKPPLVFEMLALGKPVVGVIYPMKTGNGRWVGRPVPGDQVPIDGFLNVEGVGGGVLLISREAVTKLIEDLPEIIDDSPMGMQPARSVLESAGLTRVIHAFDKTKDEVGRELSEDFSFCHRWRSVGGEVWANVSHDVGHVGLWEFHGNYHDHLSKQ